MSKATVWVYPPMPQQKFFADTAFGSNSNSFPQMISYPSPLIYSNAVRESIFYFENGSIGFKLEDGSLVRVVGMPYLVQSEPEVKNIETV